MKRILKFHTLFLLAALSIFSFSCKKDAPSSTIQAHTFSTNTWSYNSPGYYQDLSVSDITSSNLSSASVNVYFSTDAGNNWIALPYTQYNGSSPNYFMNFTTRVGNVRITWIYNSSLSTGNDPNTYFGTTVQFKVVVTSSAARKSNPNLDWNNYEAVKNEFNLDQ